MYSNSPSGIYNMIDIHLSTDTSSWLFVLYLIIYWFNTCETTPMSSNRARIRILSQNNNEKSLVRLVITNYWFSYQINYKYAGKWMVRHPHLQSAGNVSCSPWDLMLFGSKQCTATSIVWKEKPAGTITRNQEYKTAINKVISVIVTGIGACTLCNALHYAFEEVWSCSLAYYKLPNFRIKPR